MDENRRGKYAAYWPQFAYGNWSTVENYVHDNNMANPAGGGYTGQIPPGMGVVGVCHALANCGV